MTDDDDGASPGPGGVLKSTRESLRYSQQDIADALNLTVRVIEDIERERWQNFHAMAFARGYIKAYAKLLNLDADELVRGYEGLREPATPPAPASPLVSRLAASGGGMAETFQRQPGAVLSGAVVLAVCVVAIVLFLVWPDEVDEPPPVAALKPVPQLATESTGRRREPSPPPVDGRPAPGGADNPSPGAEGTEPLFTTAEPPSEAEEPDVVEVEIEDTDMEEAAVEGGALSAMQAPPSLRAATTAKRITPLGDDRLDFSFSDDCWVEIKDETGRTLYSDLSRAGDNLSLIGRSPFRVLLGYSPAVAMALNGNPIALAPYTRNNVASFAVGN